MDWKTRILTALETAAHAPQPEVIEELAQHAQSLYEAARAEGCPTREAERRVVAQIERWRLEAAMLRHASRRPAAVEPPPASVSGLGDVTLDVRYAARLLRRQPRHAVLTIVTMALGIAATATLFSVTYGVLLKPLPWPHADKLVQLGETRGGAPPRFGSFTNAVYLAWKDQATTIDGIAGWSARAVTLTGSGDPERVRIVSCSASLFPILGARPLVGSLFDEADETLRDPSVIVLSERLWRRRFGADPGVVGRRLELDGRPHAVVGVLPDALAFPDRFVLAWVPYRIQPATGNFLSMFNAIARLRPGVTPDQAAAEGSARGQNAPDTSLTTTAIFGNNGPVQVSATGFLDAATADVRRPLIVLFIGVGLLLVTATANVASLHLARLTTRRREVAIRAALGAGSSRVIRQLVVESLLLGLLGGAAGLGLATALLRGLPAILPAGFPRLDDIGLDLTVIAFVTVLSIGVGVAFGAVPALTVRRLNLAETLADRGAVAQSHGPRLRTAHLRLAIMAGQVAIACVLLIGASLLGRSFVKLLNVDRGYDPAGVVISMIPMQAPGYPPERRFELLNRILSATRRAPGVTAVAFTSELPLTAGGSTMAFTLPPRGPSRQVTSVQASPRIVSPEYFSVLRMRILEGRGFAESDTDTSPTVVVVNRSFARTYLGDAALGSRLPVTGYAPEEGEARESTVVGVVEDVRYGMAGDATQPEVFYTHRQMRGRLSVPVIAVMARTTGDGSSVVPALRTVVRDADAGLVPDRIMLLEDGVLTSLARPRFYAFLLGGFAVLAVIVAGVGLFGVLSYSVAQRSRELALRVALGASRMDVVRIVLRQGAVVTALGILAGVCASFILMRSIAALLFGVTSHDGLTYMAVPLALAAIAAAACFGPARRAARLDPLTGIRDP